MRLRLRVCDFVAKKTTNYTTDDKRRAVCENSPANTRSFLFDKAQKTTKKMTIRA